MVAPPVSVCFSYTPQNFLPNFLPQRFALPLSTPKSPINLLLALQAILERLVVFFKWCVD